MAPRQSAINIIEGIFSFKTVNENAYILKFDSEIGFQEIGFRQIALRSDILENEGGW